MPRVFFSSVLLIAINLLPLWLIEPTPLGVASMLYLYWLETFLFTILGLIKVKMASRDAGFFAIHAMGFNLGHLLFLSVFGYIIIFANENVGFANFLGLVVKNIGLIFILLVGSRIFSFYQNFIKGKEYLNYRPDGMSIMGPVYGRIILMHLVILGGALLGFYQMFIILKTIIDLIGHLVEHRKKLQIAVTVS